MNCYGYQVVASPRDTLQFYAPGQGTSERLNPLPSITQLVSVRGRDPEHFFF
jgi:hypothetical protein